MISSLSCLSLLSALSSFPYAFSVLLVVSVGLWVPVRDAHLTVFAGGCQRGAVHEENLLQAAAAVLHSPGHWHAVFQRPVSAHPRGRVLRWLEPRFNCSLARALVTQSKAHLTFRKALLNQKICCGTN